MTSAAECLICRPPRCMVHECNSRERVYRGRCSDCRERDRCLVCRSAWGLHYQSCPTLKKPPTPHQWRTRYRKISKLASEHKVSVMETLGYDAFMHTTDENFVCVREQLLGLLWERAWSVKERQ